MKKAIGRGAIGFFNQTTPTRGDTNPRRGGSFLFLIVFFILWCISFSPLTICFSPGVFISRRKNGTGIGRVERNPEMNN